MHAVGNLERFGGLQKPPFFIVSAREMEAPGSCKAPLDEQALRKWLEQSAEDGMMVKGTCPQMYS